MPEKSWRRRDLDAHPVRDARLGGPLAGEPDGVLVVVRRRRTVARGKACASSTADAPSPQPTSATRPPARSLSSTPSSAGSQRGDEVRGVAGAEQQLAAEEHVVVVLVPAHPGTGAERLGDPRLGAQRAEGEHEGARQVEGALGVGEGERLLGGEVERAGRRVVLDVAACGLPAPATPRRNGGRCRCGRRARRGWPALRERRVEPEAVPDDDTARGGRRPEVADHAPEQGVEPVGVHLRRGLCGRCRCGHRLLRSVG